MIKKTLNHTVGVMVWGAIASGSRFYDFLNCAIWKPFSLRYFSKTKCVHMWPDKH